MLKFKQKYFKTDNLRLGQYWDLLVFVSCLLFDQNIINIGLSHCLNSGFFNVDPHYNKCLYFLILELPYNVIKANIIYLRPFLDFCEIGIIIKGSQYEGLT
jgi:hypothetical protein